MKQKTLELIGTFPDDGNNTFKKRMRFHQGWWRAFVLGKEEGTYKDPHGIVKRCCSILKPEDAENGLNFVTADIFTIAKTFADIPGKLIESRRLNNNLLSSQPMAFNFFGEPCYDSDLAKQFLSKFIPNLTKVDIVDFESKPKNTIDSSAFDVGFYIDKDGQKGFVGYECKYTDEFSYKDSNGVYYGDYERKESYKKYHEVYLRHRDHFKDDYFSYVRSKDFNQLFRNEIMAKLMEEKQIDETQNIDFALTGLFCHNDDIKTKETAKMFVKKLGDGKSKFRLFTNSDFFEIVRQLTLTPMQEYWLRMLMVRYNPEFSNEIYKICTAM